MKLKEQKYIFSRNTKGVFWKSTIDTYKGMMSRKAMRKQFPLEIFKITPLEYDGETYKQDPLNTKQLTLI